MISFSSQAWSEYNTWLDDDKKIYKKLQKLIKEVLRNPYEGTGKPEPLKHNLSGYWSRRINSEHRLVYKIENKHLIILSCKHHY